ALACCPGSSPVVTRTDPRINPAHSRRRRPRAQRDLGPSRSDREAEKRGLGRPRTKRWSRSEWNTRGRHNELVYPSMRRCLVSSLSRPRSGVCGSGSSLPRSSRRSSRRTFFSSLVTMLALVLRPPKDRCPSVPRAGPPERCRATVTLTSPAAPPHGSLTPANDLQRTCAPVERSRLRRSGRGNNAHRRLLHGSLKLSGVRLQDIKAHASALPAPHGRWPPGLPQASRL